MPFDAVQFIATRTVAENAGASRQSANRIGLVTGVANLGLVPGVVLAQAAGRREAAAVPSTPPQPPQPGKVIKLPSFVGESYSEVFDWLNKEGLTPVQKLYEACEDEENRGKILAQDPKEGAYVDPGDTVELVVCATHADQDSDGVEIGRTVRKIEDQVNTLVDNQKDIRGLLNELVGKVNPPDEVNTRSGSASSQTKSKPSQEEKS